MLNAQHVPTAAARLTPVGHLTASHRLNLAIGLPLRNQQQLDALLQQLYDPASPNYRRYLAPEEFTEQFGPTETDYQALMDFAKSYGLTVTATHPNRVVLEVEGSVADIERAFHVTLRRYRHPTEARDFFAPDTEPSVPTNLSVVTVEGLSDYSLPRHSGRKVPAAKVRPLSFNGSGPNQEYAGNDFRNAYIPGSVLNGAGQTVALLEYSDYYKVDVTNYENLVGGIIGSTNYVPLTNVVLSGGSPGTGNNDEVALDIEMAIAMAPKLSRVIVYESKSVSSSLLNRIATDNLAKQVSSSWSVGPWSSSTATTYDNILKNMAAQGQSYFQSSGDSDAYTGAQPLDSGTTVPMDSPYATIVGGTTLTMNGKGASWSSETVWNYNPNGLPNEGSGGGISSYYAIPSWQTNVSMVNNSGSTANRNIPDVALTADNIFVSYNNGDYSGTYYFMGTSCAAPLWAGFTALVNQQSVATRGTTVGFLNPALYAIGTGASFAACFHDATTGNNIGTNTPGLFYAANGYDLCTGWGTPAGTNLINALTLPPTVNFTGTPTNGVAPLTVSFTNLSTGANSYQWTLGDGRTSTSANPANTYSNAGSYSVALTAIAAGGTNTLTRTSYIVVLAPVVSVAGTAAYYPTNYPSSGLSGKVVGGVTMAVTGDTNLSGVTLGDGSYALGGMAYGGTYCVTPSKADDSPTNRAVTSADAALIQRYVVGLAPLDSPYKLLAADVNANGVVNTADATMIQRMVVGLLNTFPAGTWRFVPANYVFLDPENPWNAPSNVWYTNLVADVSDGDFIAIRLGDLNNSWTAPAGGSSSQARRVKVPAKGAEGSEARVTGGVPEVVFGVSPQSGQAGQTVVVGVRVSGFRQVTSAQFSLAWDPAVLRYVGTGSYGLRGMSAGSFGSTWAGSGKLAFGWYDPEAVGVTLADGTVLFTASFEVIGRAGSVSAVVLADSPTAQDVGVDFGLAGLVAQDGSVSVVGPGVVVNQPGYAGGVFHLSVPTEAGRLYSLEYSDTLAPAQWTALPAVVGEGTVTVLVDPAATNQQRFYRVHIQ